MMIYNHKKVVLNQVVVQAFTVVLGIISVFVFISVITSGMDHTAYARDKDPKPIEVCPYPGECDFQSLNEAINEAEKNDTSNIINIAPGVYTETGQILISVPLTITGSTDPGSETKIVPAESLPYDTPWFLVEEGASLTLRNVSMDGRSSAGISIHEGIKLLGPGNIENNEFRNIAFDNAEPYGDPYGKPGTAIYLGSGDTIIGNNRFSSIGSIGILACGQSVTSTMISKNVYTGKGGTEQIDVGVWIGGGAAMKVTNNTIISNTGVVTLTYPNTLHSAGIRVDDGELFCPDSAATVDIVIESNTILSNDIGIHVGSNSLDQSLINAKFNRVVGNGTGVKAVNVDKTQVANKNWWGCNDGSNHSGCDTALGTVDFSDNLKLEVEIIPTLIMVGENASVTATIRSDSGYVPDGTLVMFQADTDLGSLSPTSTLSMIGGQANTTFTATGGTGSVVISTTVDNETIANEITIDFANIYLPIIKMDKPSIIIENPLTNGDFEDGLNGWVSDQGPFLGHGSGLPQGTIASGEDDYGDVALLGNPNFGNNSIPVGYGVISQTFTVEGKTLELHYRVWSYDIVKGSQGWYFDTFEVSVNSSPEVITDGERNDIGCDNENARLNPNDVSIEVPSGGGLLFCGGGVGETDDGKDTGWLTVMLNLENFSIGEDITLYFTTWSREYEIKFRDDKAYYNTWAWVDNVKYKEP